jgi:hypothetical protein
MAKELQASQQLDGDDGGARICHYVSTIIIIICHIRRTEHGLFINSSRSKATLAANFSILDICC